MEVLRPSSLSTNLFGLGHQMCVAFLFTFLSLSVLSVKWAYRGFKVWACVGITGGTSMGIWFCLHHCLWLWYEDSPLGSVGSYEETGELLELILSIP